LKPEILAFKVNDTQEQKVVERKKDEKMGPESEINDRSEPELRASGGNSMADVDRASTYSDTDRDKQFYQKGSDSMATGRRGETSSKEDAKKVEDRVVKDAKVVEADVKKAGHKLADDTQKVTKKVKDKI
jgi:hypothetical protein